MLLTTVNNLKDQAVSLLQLDIMKNEKDLVKLTKEFISTFQDNSLISSRTTAAMLLQLLDDLIDGNSIGPSMDKDVMTIVSFAAELRKNYITEIGFTFREEELGGGGGDTFGGNNGVNEIGRTTFSNIIVPTVLDYDKVGLPKKITFPTNKSKNDLVSFIKDVFDQSGIYDLINITSSFMKADFENEVDALANRFRTRDSDLTSNFDETTFKVELERLFLSWKNKRKNCLLIKG